MSSARPRVALIGHGRWGKNVGRVLSRLPECEFATLCDSDAARLCAIAPGVSLTPRLDEVLDDPSLDACVICTPAPLHAEHATRALHAGKHVFVEKPMALSEAEGRRVAAAVELTGRRLMVGHIVLYHPAFRELAKLVRSGDLGRIRRIATVRTASLQRGSAEDPWWALAPHDLSLLSALVPAPAIAIRARRDTGGIRPAVHADIAFADDTRADVIVGGDLDRTRSVTVIGDAGSACFRDEVAPGRVDVYAAAPGRPLREASADRPIRSLPIPAAEPLELELRHFVDCIARQRPFRTDHEHGLRVTEMLDAGERACVAGDGQPITLAAESSFGRRRVSA